MHRIGVAVKNIVAIPAVEDVVPASGLLIHAEAIAIQDVVTPQAIERLIRSLLPSMVRAIANCPPVDGHYSLTRMVRPSSQYGDRWVSVL